MHPLLQAAIAKSVGAGAVAKAARKSLYVCRPLLNADEVLAWAKSQGFKMALAPEDMHVTVACSKTPVNWQQIGDDWNDRPEWAPPMPYAAGISNGPGRQDYADSDPPGSLRVRGGPRDVQLLGEDGAVVLCFQSLPLVKRWCAFMRAGCSWDYPSFSPHLTLTYQSKGLDLAKMTPFAGDLVLGEEEWDEIDEDMEAEEAET